MSDAIVFLGPTLSVADARTLLPAARFAPPVKAGDLLALQRLPGEPPVIAIVDGVFERVQSVWHKEILLALARGSPVYGAASMGALRAAELERFGMIGVGRVFEGYRDGTFRDDADVAVMHAPVEHGAAALTVPIVDLHATDPMLAAAARARFYRERTASGETVAQKRADAVALLAALDRERPRARAPRSELHVPSVFVRRLAAWIACRPMPFAAPWLPEVERLARLARMLGPRYVLVRHLALANAIAAALNVAPRTGAPEAEVQLARLLGYHRAPDVPQVASARRIIGALARVTQALFDRLAADGVTVAPDDDALLAFAADLQARRLGLTSSGERDTWLAANGLTSPREHVAFLRFAFAFEHALDPRSLGLWGGIEVDLRRSWLVEALDETGLLEELTTRSADWPTLAAQIRAFWSQMTPEVREQRARDCDLAGFGEIERATATTPSP